MDRRQGKSFPWKNVAGIMEWDHLIVQLLTQSWIRATVYILAKNAKCSLLC